MYNSASFGCVLRHALCCCCSMKKVDLIAIHTLSTSCNPSSSVWGDNNKQEEDAKEEGYKCDPKVADRALIAYASYDSPSLSCGGVSMTDEAQVMVMAKLCFGSPDEDPGVICFVNQFLHGLNKFSGLFTASDEVQPGVANNMNSTTGPELSRMLLTLSPILHQLGPEVNVFVGEGSIKKSLLCGKTVANSTVHVTGRTMLRHAKDVLCNCKKMMVIVTAPNSPSKDGNFPSGTNLEDYMKWCLICMNKDILADATTACIAVDAVAVDAVEPSFKSTCRRRQR